MNPNKSYDNTFENRCNQFEKDQKSPNAGSCNHTSKKSSKTSSDTNPYLRARIQVLQDFPDWRRREIQEMEKTGDINNKFYNDFIHMVAQLGDVFSNS